MIFFFRKTVRKFVLFTNLIFFLVSDVVSDECHDYGGTNVTDESDTQRENNVNDIFIRLYYGPSMCDYNVTHLRYWAQLLDSPEYMRDEPSTLYIHGFTETPVSRSILVLGRAYLTRRTSHNFFYLDWSNMNHPPYFFNALPNCPKVANETARILHTLLGRGLELNKFHVVGHSLGGQISGMLGKAMQADYGIVLSRISGLDPAGPGFNTEVYSETHLDPTDADFVDVVHTDALKFGTIRRCGDADFWPNAGVAHPGCPEDSARDKVFCSHQRSWIYWAESVITPHAFGARWIPTVTDVHFLDSSRQNETHFKTYMGIAANMSARGDYILITNANSPYGRGEEGI